MGSALIGQAFTQPYYFHPRPSAAGNGYDATASSGTNKGPTDLKLADTLIAQAVDSAVKNDGAVKGRIPGGHGDVVRVGPRSAHLAGERASAGGAGGRRARRDPPAVQALVDRHVEGRQFGFFGEPRVNVLLLNIALDSALAKRAEITQIQEHP